MAEAAGWRAVATRVRRHPVLAVHLAVTIAAVVATALAPEPMGRWTAPDEGPFEQISHVVLLAALVAWVAVALRARTALSMGAAGYVGLMMLEEIDWGAVYGVNLGHKALDALLGIPALHHHQWDADAIWEDKLFWFTIPVLAYFALPFALRRRRELLERLAPVAPRPEEGVLLFVVLGTYMFIDAVIPRLMCIYQGVTYVLVAWVGWRVLGELRARA